MSNRNKTIHLFAFAVLITQVNVIYAGTYSGGMGTEGEPYLISSVMDFDELRNTPSDYGKYFEQTDHIDLSNQIYFGAVIAPDTDAGASGFQGSSFTGTYDGKGHKILNFKTTVIFGKSEYVGIFGYNKGTIKNLIIKNGYISLLQGERVGILCGFNYGGTIENCQIEGTVICGSNSVNVGGACGFTEGIRSAVPHIIKCTSTASVVAGESSNYIGGFCGQQYTYTSDDRSSAAYISLCSSAGSVVCGNNSSYIGGFCGRNYGVDDYYPKGSNTNRISNCYTQSDITIGSDSSYVGGFCGRSYPNGVLAHAYIINSYSLGNIIIGENESNLGDFCGKNSGSISCCFWDIDTSQMDNSSGAQGLTNEQMKEILIYLGYGWDFAGYTTNGTDDYWVMSTYPKFSWEDTPTDVVPNIKNMLFSMAEITLSNNNLNVGFLSYEYSSDILKGKIINQYPAENTHLYAGDRIDVVVSLGKECQIYYMGDVNGDCIVDLTDLIYISNDWLKNSEVESDLL